MYLIYWNLIMVQSINYTFSLSLVIIILGILLRKWNVITNENGKFMTKLVFRLTLPALILDTIPYVTLDTSLFIMPVISFVYSIIVSLSVYFFIRKNPDSDDKGLMLMTTIGFNIGNFAFPLIEGVWGKEGLQYIAMFDVGNVFTIFLLIYIFGAIYSPKLKDSDESEKRVDGKELLGKISKSAPLLAYIFGLLFNMVGVTFPLFVQDTISIIARANMLLVLLTLGVFLDFSFEKSKWGKILKILLIRYGFGLSIGFLLYYTLPFDQLTRTIALIGLVLPVAMGSLVFSVEFEYDEKIFATLNNLTILTSFILVWILLLVLV